MNRPGIRFYLFGMGNRRKLLYRSGVLRDVLGGDTLRRWDVVEESIQPAEFRVELQTRHGEHVCICEDGDAVWLVEGSRRTCLTAGAVNLPQFDDRTHVPGEPFTARSRGLYPYLAWAKAHFHNRPPPAPIDLTTYPLTWEAQASEADFAKMAAISEVYANQRTSAPHAWHAAEVFLYFWGAPGRHARTEADEST